MSVPEVGLIGDIGATNARFRVGPSGRQHRDSQIPSLLSRRGTNNHVRDGSHQVLRWFMKSPWVAGATTAQPSKSWSREELARRVNRSGNPMIPALLVRASALCHTIADLFIEQRAPRKWPRFIFDAYQYCAHCFAVGRQFSRWQPARRMKSYSLKGVR
jgi:hypothetical protein